MRRVALLVILALLPALTAGCDEGTLPAPPPGPKPKTTEPAKVVPKLPDEETSDAAMKLLIKNPNADRTGDEDAYKVDARMPSGTLVGACKWASPVVRWGGVPRPDPIKLEGELAIKEPQPGEEKYYRNIGLRGRWYFVNNYLRTHPTGVVVMMRRIKRGRRPMLDRPTFIIREGRFRPHMLFAPLHDRVMFGTYDSYPTHVQVKSVTSRKVILDGVVAAFDRATIKPLGGGGTHYTARPTMLGSEAADELGPYEIRAKRHPWKRAYVIFVDNPYCVVSNGPKFTMRAVPVGTWDIGVWHPEFRLVQNSYRVTIKKDETTELGIMVHPPDRLMPKKRGK